MNTIEQLKEKHAQEIAALEKELALANSLPLPATLICQHKEYATIKYWKQFPARYTLKEAVGIYRMFAADVVEAEHWRSGCLSVAPAEVNSYAKDERATMGLLRLTTRHMKTFRVIGKTAKGDTVVLFPGPLTHAEACRCKSALTPQPWRTDMLEGITTATDNVKEIHAPIPCDCGSKQAHWRGQRTGRRSYMCDECAAAMVKFGTALAEEMQRD
jgi:hypothetical protein